MDETEKTTYVIDGKGFHRGIIPIHLVSIAIIWVLLRVTLFDGITEHNQIQYLAGSITIAICAHMAMMGRILQDFSEVRQVSSLVRRFSDKHGSPLTAPEVFQRIGELLDNGRTIIPIPGNTKLFVLEDDKDTKSRMLQIK